MKNSFYKATSASLILGAILVTITMILHPVGGDIEHLIRISDRILITHLMAILAIPLLIFGFYGLSIRLQDDKRISQLAFIFLLFGMLSAFFAALFNGVALPIYLNGKEAATGQELINIKSILSYGFAINKALDYLFIGLTVIAIFLWSLNIVSQKAIAKWIGYLGIGLGIIAVIGIILGYNMQNLHTFRVVIFGLVIWMLATGMALRKVKV